MWSYADELADKHSGLNNGKERKIRAIDNCHKAGYGLTVFEKHAINDEK